MQTDAQLPEVARRAWDLLSEKYTLPALTGPTDAEVLKRKAQKWCATVEKGDDLVSIDLFVLTRDADEEIPGVVRHQYLDGETVYFASGLASIGGVQRKLTPEEVEVRRPGIPIKVVLETLNPQHKINIHLSPYKNNYEGAQRLVSNISIGLAEAGISPQD